MKDNFEIWNAVSMAWTEIGLEDTEYPRIAKKIKETHPTWEEVDLIIKKDVCGSFAFDTFLIFPCMLWMIMPDSRYDSDYLKERMGRWHSKPYYKHFLNPIRVLGYPMSLLMTASVRSKLRSSFHNL